MYLHLGQEVVIRTQDIIGIFDLEKTSVSKRTKEFLVEAAHRDEVVTVSYEMPKSFILTGQKGSRQIAEIEKEKADGCKENTTTGINNINENKVYISQISTATLKKRMKS